MSNEANGGGKSRAEALEAVAEAARAWLNTVSGLPYQNGAEADAMGRCEQALVALHALPAAPEPARGEVVEVAVWRVGDPVMTRHRRYVAPVTTPAEVAALRAHVAKQARIMAVLLAHASSAPLTDEDMQWARAQVAALEPTR